MDITLAAQLKRIKAIEKREETESRGVEQSATHPHRQSELELMERLNTTQFSKFKFQIEADEAGYYVTDARKNPSKRINSRPYQTLDYALAYLGKRILDEFTARNDLWIENRKLKTALNIAP